MIYWITGKPGAGKTYHAQELKEKLEWNGRSVLLLDGDGVRKYFPTGFSDEEREEHIMRMAKIAAIAEQQDINVIIACVSPKKEWRNKARKLFKESQLIFVTGGDLWPGTTYEDPTDEYNIVIVI